MKRFLGVACALLILFVNAPMAFAASSSPADAVDTENFDDALEYISSQEVKSQIYNEIDFNKEGTQSIDVGNGIIFKYVYSENVQSTARAYSVKSATMSGHFYLKSNGQKVATYSLAASFHYNGSSVYALESEVQVSSSAISGWSVIRKFFYFIRVRRGHQSMHLTNFIIMATIIMILSWICPVMQMEI